MDAAPSGSKAARSKSYPTERCSLRPISQDICSFIFFGLSWFHFYGFPNLRMQRAPPNLPHPALLHGPLRLLALLLKPFSDEHQERHFERQFSYRTAVVLVRLPYQIRDRSMHFFGLLSTKACDRGPRRQSRLAFNSKVECDVTLALGDPGVYPGSVACLPNKASASAQYFCFARRGAHRKAVEDSLRLAHVFP